MKFDREKLKSTRKTYSERELDEQSVLKDPMMQFHEWFKLVFDQDKPETNAMTLATCNKEGQPSSRIVLLKDYGPQGFVFFTNYYSRKGTELSNNNKAALLFYWPDFDRQIRIEGIVEMVPNEVSDEYFRSRPRGSQLGAIASPQSSVVSSRLELAEMFEKVSKKYSDKEVQRPEHWGGYILRPAYFEFWQGRVNRLHDRIAYSRSKGGDTWIINRLAP